MPRRGVSKKKKSPRATELSQLKQEVQRLTEQLESRDRELAEPQSGRQRQVTFCALSPARPMTCGRYWKWWRRTRRVCVGRLMH